MFTKINFNNEKEKDWGLSFNKILFGKEELANDKPMLLRIEYGVINGNRKWQEILEQNFFNELIQHNKCFKGKGYNDGHSYFHYYCNNDTDLSTFSKMHFIIDEEFAADDEEQDDAGDDRGQRAGHVEVLADLGRALVQHLNQAGGKNHEQRVEFAQPAHHDGGEALAADRVGGHGLVHARGDQVAHQAAEHAA